MALTLVNHAPKDAGTLRVWAGIAGQDANAALAWRLDGQAAQPTALRALSDWQIPGHPPFCSGVFEFAGLQPGSTHEVALSVGAETVVRTLRTLPAAVPDQPGESFRLLLLSCFHRAQDMTGNAGRVLASLMPRPDLTVFAGDQVYLDLPTQRDFKDDRDWLEAKFQQDYLDNWFGDDGAPPKPHEVARGFPQLLSLAPMVSLPDDHEYWNNAPFRSPFIQNSWTNRGRTLWRDAAQKAIEMFQLGSAYPLGTPRRIEVDPLSILLLDTRSLRDQGAQTDAPDTKAMRVGDGDLLGAAGRQAVEDWATDLVASAAGGTPRYGLLVTGQSLFVPAAGNLNGNIADFEFPDYPADHAHLVEQVERVSRAGLPVVCLTGDVHWGRILRADGGRDRAPIYEIVSSPTSLVASVGIDQLKGATARIKGLVGPRDPWPLHSEAAEPPARFGREGSYTCTVLQSTSGQRCAMRGNMALMLRLRRLGDALDVRVDYLPLHTDDAWNEKNRWQAAFVLRPQV